MFSKVFGHFPAIILILTRHHDALQTFTLPLPKCPLFVNAWNPFTFLGNPTSTYPLLLASWLPCLAWCWPCLISRSCSRLLTGTSLSKLLTSSRSVALLNPLSWLRLRCLLLLLAWLVSIMVIALLADIIYMLTLLMLVFFWVILCLDGDVALIDSVDPSCRIKVCRVPNRFRKVIFCCRNFHDI